MKWDKTAIRELAVRIAGKQMIENQWLPNGISWVLMDKRLNCTGLCSAKTPS